MSRGPWIVSIFILLSGLRPATAAAPSPGASHPALSFPGFLANQGQLGGGARYYARGAESAVYFEPAAILLERSLPERGQGVVLRVEFPAARERPSPQPQSPLAHRFNVYAGEDPSSWRRGVPAYARVCYSDIAPGADLVYRVEDGRLEYDVVLAPGADPEQVRLRYRGAERLSLGADGGLVIHTGAGDLREDRPHLYQEREGRRVTVAGGFRLRSRDELGFWIGDHDRDLPLVVDPGLLWSTFEGGGADDVAYGVVSDAAGNVYVAGRTFSTDYPTTTGAYQRSLAGASDVIVTKLLANGTGIAWSTMLGGTGLEEGRSVALDASGNLFVCGHTGSLDFPTTTGAFRQQSGGGVYDGFLAKLGADGSLRFSTYLGGGGDDYARAVRVDGSGNPVVAGQTGSVDFPTTAGVVRPARNPSFFDGSDGFLTKLNGAGTALIYSTYIGSNANSEGVNGLVLDGSGRPVLTGNTASSTFPVTSGALDTQLGGPQDAFVTCLNAGATAYVFSTYLGGVAYEAGVGVGVAPDGSIVVAGRTSSSDFPVTAGALQTAFGGGNYYDVFVTRLTPSGGSLVYSTYLGSGGTDTPWGLYVTSSGQACVTGYTDSGGFPVTSGAYDASFNGGLDAMLAVVSPDGSQLQYSTVLGGTGNDQGQGITGRSGGQLVVCGLTSDGSFPTTAGAYDRSHNSPGTNDGFVMVLEPGLPASVGVADLPGRRLDLLPPSPNPFTTSTGTGLTLAEPADVSVRILDPAGRLVRELFRGWLGPGRHGWSWDGRRSDGLDSGSGVFFVEVTAGPSRGVSRIIRLR